MVSDLFGCCWPQNTSRINKQNRYFELHRYDGWFFSQNVKKSNSDDCMRYVDMFPDDLKAPHGKDYIGPK